MTKVKFSTHWKKSIQPRRQRKYRYNAPLHIQQKFSHVHLSPELRKKYTRRSLQVRVGDMVKILRGTFAKKDGKVERVDLKHEHVFVTGINHLKKDGTTVPAPLKPSKLMIIELKLDDKLRREKLEKKVLKSTEAKPASSKEKKK